MTKYVIKSTEREEPNCYFVAVHSFTPFFSKMEDAKQFGTVEDATAFARAELFTTDSAFEILPV